MRKFIELSDGILYEITYSDNEYDPFDKNLHKKSFVIAPDISNAIKMFSKATYHIIIISIRVVMVHAIIDTESINTEREFEY